MRKIERKNTVCFTGHRPEKLHMAEKEVIDRLKTEIEQAYVEGYFCFISGMARGVDIWAAEIVLELRKMHPEVSLVCAVPYPDFEKRWAKKWQDRYAAILAAADHVVYIGTAHSRRIYQQRNEWMCGRSSLVIAVWNGQPSGTGNTVAYAKKTGVEVISIGAN